MSRRSGTHDSLSATLEITRGEDLRLSVSASLDALPSVGISRRNDDQVVERFRRAAFSLIQTGAWSLVFSHPLT
jgi:hypothetical protein